MKDLETENLILGTAQFGQEYGIANRSGKPSKEDVFKILSTAWESGIRWYDTAPAYNSEELLGEFISAHGLDKEVSIITKVPSLHDSINLKSDILQSVEKSREKLCCPIHVLLLHDSSDSRILLDNFDSIQEIVDEGLIGVFGVSIYEEAEILLLEKKSDNFALQFPFNLLDNRFSNAVDDFKFRFARSVFLQGVLSSREELNSNAPADLKKFHAEYVKKLTSLKLDPIQIALSYAMNSSSVDKVLIGVDSESQLEEIVNVEIVKEEQVKDIVKSLGISISANMLDPRNW